VDSAWSGSDPLCWSGLFNSDGTRCARRPMELQREAGCSFCPGSTSPIETHPGPRFPSTPYGGVATLSGVNQCGGKCARGTRPSRASIRPAISGTVRRPASTWIFRPRTPARWSLDVMRISPPKSHTLFHVVRDCTRPQKGVGVDPFDSTTFDAHLTVCIAGGLDARLANLRMRLPWRPDQHAGRALKFTSSWSRCGRSAHSADCRHSHTSCG